ncbi:MAG TPA: signal peptidase II, partial [Chitinophagales bacterium]|nr:signal peptidase II [Chitinophagales bacterium]
MLRFPLYHGFLPKWIPFWGGEYFEFFNAIFNIADSAITVGVFLILIFQGVFFKEQEAVEQAADLG